MKSNDYRNLSMNFITKKQNSLDIENLRDEYLAGNERSFAIIYELYAKDLYAFGLSLRAKPQLIEDAIHDVFVEIHTHRQNLEKINNLKFYFLAAFRNRLFFLLKKESNTVEISERDTVDLLDKDVQTMWIEKEDETEKQLLLKRLLSELTEHQQEALYHRFVGGLSCDEIAILMKINYQSTKNLIHRAIKKMKSIAIFESLLLIMIFTFS